MPDPAGGVGEHAGLLVENQRVRFPARPKLQGGADELVGALVAELVAEVIVVTEVLRLTLGQRRHDVPGDPPTGDVVEAGEDPGQLVGVKKIGGGLGDC